MTNELDSLSPSPTALQTEEPIPGYRLVERIGIGGYGEVWKVEAPGGLTKAAKLVYGHMDDERAARELKALNRIKQVRHPFLLSLERIEVVNGRLIVITELAETNLKEVLTECQESGMSGVPRERLLKYLKDAAEALDYIRDDYHLQHLDVKPENLLLVGDRVKVADFGLVRELVNTNVSMMGGLTPTYAPPEVFDGRPDRQSDQYSLAIVYQEMLTGAVPFDGRTAAQLAAQHMHSQPKLETLPPADRVAVARALSKDPGKRFAGCRAFIETLMKPEMAAAATVIQASSRSTNFSGPNRTISLDEINRTNQTLEKSPLPNRDVDMADLAPLELTGKHACRPTLFLGVGGAAVEILRLLRRRLHDRLGDLNEVPAIQILAIDSDRSALTLACTDNNTAALATRETLALPLRRTQDYRSESDKYLSWLSRRWLYNIPRSQQTEGLRPLGRLVMIDHGEQLMQRIRELIGVLSEEDAIHASSKASGTPFAVAAPRVFIVTSIAGGSGSGMVLDIAYAVRQILTEYGHPDDGVCGILTHHTDRRASAKDLALANTLACLTELKHYSQPAGHYPGDANLGLASFNGSTFHHGYFVHLGDDLEAAELGDQLDRVAEYLFCNAVTRAGEFFDQSRQHEHQEHPVPCPETTLRSFGLYQLGLSNSDVPTELADAICSRLMEDWRGGPQTASDSQPLKFSDVTAGSKTAADKSSAFNTTVDRLAEEQAEKLKLDIEPLSQEIMALAGEEMRCDPKDYFSELAKLRSQQTPHKDATAIQDLMDLTDRMLGTDATDGAPDGTFLPLQAVINDRLKEVADQRGSMLREWLWEMVDNSRGRIRGARRATAWLAKYLQNMARQASDLVKTHSEEALHVRGRLLATATQDAPKDLADNPLLSSYYQLRLNQTVMRAVAKTFRSIDEIHVAAAAEQLQGLLRELDALNSKFKTPPAPQLSPPSAHSDAVTFRQYIRSSSQTALSHRLAEFAADVETGLFGNNGGLRVLLASNTGLQSDLADVLRTTASQVLRRAVREVNVAELVLAVTASSKDATHSPLQTCVQIAQPRMTKCGGARRLLSVVPESSAREPIAASLEHYLKKSLNLVFDTDGDLVFCYEAEGLEITDLAWSLIGDRPDLLQVAARLHTRTDVDWLSLV